MALDVLRWIDVRYQPAQNVFDYNWYLAMVYFSYQQRSQFLLTAQQVHTTAV